MRDDLNLFFLVELLARTKGVDNTEFVLLQQFLPHWLRAYLEPVKDYLTKKQSKP